MLAAWQQASQGSTCGKKTAKEYDGKNVAMAQKYCKTKGVISEFYRAELIARGADASHEGEGCCGLTCAICTRAGCRTIAADATTDRGKRVNGVESRARVIYSPVPVLEAIFTRHA
ncbi:hypothetical protein PUN28_009247 [Cardiocondyla obscurior]|uniref:Uncharacterized protein n=1 Tax=Cardiocondyla obscurior TaxID=286306 RepID=A0AAW2FUG6_9HYME